MDNTAKIEVQPIEDEEVRYEVSDEELEVAAEASGRTYTHQTSASRRCCR